MAVGPIYITAHTGRTIQNLKPLLESGYLTAKWDPFRDGDKERDGVQVGPRSARVGGKGRRERERRGSWITVHDVRIGLATAEPQKTGRLRRNRLRVCRERGN